MMNPNMQHNGMEKGRRKHFHGEANHGSAMTNGGEHAQAAIPWLKRCHSREHQVPGSEAERCALDCGQWWSTSGEFCRRGCGGEDGARAELGAAKQRGSAGE